LGLPTFAYDAIQWKVQVTGLRIVAPSADGKEDAQGAFFQPPGVTVVAVITMVGGKIVSIDQFKSNVEAFTDDEGTDLLAVKSENLFNKPGFGMMDSKETTATVEIYAAGVPQPGAPALNIAGKVVLQVATATKEFTIERVDIKTGSTFNLGDMAGKITKGGMSKEMCGNEEMFTEKLSSMTDLTGISKLKLLDSQDNAIEAQRSS
jgi:hypothetical protein